MSVLATAYSDDGMILEVLDIRNGRICVRSYHETNHPSRYHWVLPDSAERLGRALLKAAGKEP